ncbi:MAG: patatin-like phospholipase family protein [Acidobacteriota bacterium]
MKHTTPYRTVPVTLWVLLLVTSLGAGALGQTESGVEDSKRGERPRTCLVLSGGGARGAAHIGVLRVLEELRIPVDCIAGTSMGSIVGGLYASGLSPEALEEIVRSIDWEDAFEDAPTRRRQSFRRKEDDLLPLFPIEFGVGKGGLRTAPGLISGQKIRFIFRQMTLHTLAVEHFDQLRIPFRAVAADLSDGSLAVLDRGSLAEAMRASMAVPGIFTPVKWGDRVLVDGGITANLPIQVAQAMGAERLIAVDISGGGRELKGDETALGVLSQAFSVIHIRNVLASKRLLTDEDLLIEPDLGEIRSTSFDRVFEAIELGEAAARQSAEALGRFSVSEEAFRGFLGNHRLKPGDLELSIPLGGVEIAGGSRVAPKQVISRIETLPDDRLDLRTLRGDLDRIFQIGEFSHVDFEIDRRDSRNILVIDTEDKPWGPHYLRSGLTFSANLEGDSDFLALAHYRRTQLNRWGAEWKTVLTVGDTNSLFTEFFQPVGYRGAWFVRPRLELLEDQFLDPTGDFGGIDVEAATLALDAGVHLANAVELTLGVERGSVDVDTQIATGLEADLGGLRLGLNLDRLDDSDFPRAGILTDLDFYYSIDPLGADEKYRRLELEVLRPWSVGSHTLLGRLRLGASLGTEIPIYDHFELGGFGNLSAFQVDELRGDALGFASLTYYKRRGKLYLGGGLEVGNAWAVEDQADFDDLLTSALVFVGRETFVGPLYLGYGFGEGGRDSLYLFLGRVF